MHQTSERISVGSGGSFFVREYVIMSFITHGPSFRPTSQAQMAKFECSNPGVGVASLSKARGVVWHE
jgi:hypothetical protein